MQNPSILPSPRAIEKVPNRQGNSDPGSENLAPGRRSKENGGAAKLTWLQAGGLLLGGLVVAAIIVEIGFRIFTRSYVPQAQRTDRPDQFFFSSSCKIRS